MKHYDLIVVGGGISGVGGAVSAAREGLSVLIIEKFGSLGGAMSNSLVFPFMRHMTWGDNPKLTSAGIFREMKMRKEKYKDSSYETYKLVFDDMISEAGVDVLFHSTVFAAEWENRIIRSVKVATKAGVIELSADYFIDASGDGELIAMTGCEFQLGRESDGYCQPMTTCFRVSGVNLEQFEKDRKSLQEKYKEYRRDGKITNPRENILVFTGVGDGVLHFNTTRIVKLNPIDPFEVSRAEILARRQISEMTEFLRENSSAFKNSSIVSIANHIGIF